MKATASVFLIISLLFIAVFGLTALNHSMSHRQSDCVISLITSAPCSASIKSMMEHHISAIQSLFNVPVSTFVFFALFLFAVSLIGFAYLFKSLLLHHQFITERLREHRFGFNLAKHRLISWLSLFEHSPSI